MGARCVSLLALLGRLASVSRSSHLLVRYASLRVPKPPYAGAGGHNLRGQSAKSSIQHIMDSSRYKSRRALLHMRDSYYKQDCLFKGNLGSKAPQGKPTTEPTAAPRQADGGAPVAQQRL
eukprot:8473162-Pyramimonas_sp.AAC.1